MGLSKPALQLIFAGSVGVVTIGVLIAGFSMVEDHRTRAQESISETAMAASTAATPSEAPRRDSSVFSLVQDDASGYDGYAWNAPIAEVKRRGGAVAQTFLQEGGNHGGPLDLPTIIWIGIGLPANHRVAQAATFDPAAFSGTTFSTVQRGRTDYVFANGHFVMAVVGERTDDLTALAQKIADQNQEIPALHLEETFDLSPVGSGLPPEALSSDCYRKTNTNTRIYLVEEWGTTVLGAVKNHRAFQVYIPNVAYQAFLDEASRSAGQPGS